MARKKDIVDQPESEKELTFYAKFLNYGFSVKKVDEKGNTIYRKNNQGQDIIDKDGNKEPIIIAFKFENIERSVNIGYLSKFIWKPSKDSDSEQEKAQNSEVKKALLKLDKDEGISVEIEDKFEKRTNPKAYSEKQKVKELEGKLSDLEAERNDVDALQKRLDELLGK
jgi:hypothetical protein